MSVKKMALWNKKKTQSHRTVARKLTAELYAIYINHKKYDSFKGIYNEQATGFKNKWQLICYFKNSVSAS